MKNYWLEKKSSLPERRVFYIDVGQLPPFKAEAFIEHLKDHFCKKKTVSSSVSEELWHTSATDEDYWIPMETNERFCSFNSCN